MKLVLNIQLFASKKGVGSTKNGRDSQSKRLGAKKADGQVCDSGFNLIPSARHKDSSGCECRTRRR